MKKIVLILFLLLFLCTSVFAQQRNPVLVRDLSNRNMYYAFMPCDSGSGTTNDWSMQVISRFRDTQNDCGLFVQRDAFAGKVRPGKWQNTFSAGRYKTLGAGTENYGWYGGWRIRLLAGPYAADKIVTWNVPDGHNLIIVTCFGVSWDGGSASIKLGTADSDNTYGSELDVSTIDFNFPVSRIFDTVVAANSTSTGRVLTFGQVGATYFGVCGIRSYNTHAVAEPNELDTDGLAKGNCIPILHSNVNGNYYAGTNVSQGVTVVNGVDAWHIYHDTDVEGNMRWSNPGGTAKWCTPLSGGHLDALEDAVPKSAYRVISSQNTTFTSTSVTDASEWDLSAVITGDYVCSSTGVVGRVSTLSDAENHINVSEWYPATPTNGTVVNIVPVQNMTNILWGSNYYNASLQKRNMLSSSSTMGVAYGQIIEANTITMVDNIYSDFNASSDPTSALNLVNASIQRAFTSSGYSWNVTYKFDGETDINNTMFLGNFHFTGQPIGRVGKIVFPPDTAEYEILGTHGTGADFVVYGVNQWRIWFYDVPYELEFHTTMPLFCVYSQQLGPAAKLYGNAYKSMAAYFSLRDDTTAGPVEGDTFSYGGNVSVRVPTYCETWNDKGVDFLDFAIFASHWLGQ